MLHLFFFCFQVIQFLLANIYYKPYLPYFSFLLFLFVLITIQQIKLSFILILFYFLNCRNVTCFCLFFMLLFSSEMCCVHDFLSTLSFIAIKTAFVCHSTTCQLKKHKNHLHFYNPHLEPRFGEIILGAKKGVIECRAPSEAIFLLPKLWDFFPVLLHFIFSTFCFFLLLCFF